MDAVWQDLKFAIRLLWKDRAFAATTLLTLALCIGANTAIFTTVWSVLLRPLPFPEPDRLVFSYDAFPGAGVERAGTSVPNYLDRLSLTRTFDSQALFRFRGLDVGEPGATARVTAAEVTPSFFDVLRVRPQRGRAFTPAEGEPGRGRVAVLSDGYWRQLFSAADSAIGRELRINSEQYTVVGVMPADFAFVDPDVRVWIPLSFTDRERSENSRYSQNHDQIARLASGVTLASAQQQFDAQTARNLENAGALKPMLVNAGYHTTLVPLEADIVRNVRGSLNFLWGGVSFVLLIAAVNLTNLMLVRASGRMKELATRHALGAGHRRLARQLLTETMVLTVAGGVLGLGAGWACLRWLPTLGLSDLPRAHEIQMDAVVAAFTIGLAVALGLAIGAVPVAQLVGSNLNHLLRDESRSGTAGRGARFVRRSLVTAQVALAFVLLMGAGLLFASFRQLLAVDPGFTTAHVLTARINPPTTRYADNNRIRDLIDRALVRVRALPGVEAAGITSDLPFGGDFNSSVIFAEGYAMSPGESVISPIDLRVTQGYFEAMGIPLRTGRLFNESDGATAPRVIIVDDVLARKFWPNVDPIGRRMYLPNRPEDLVKPGPDIVWMQVVGVVGSVKLQGLIVDENNARVGAYYMPYAQQPPRRIGFAIKTTGDPIAVADALRGIVGELDPELPLFDVMAMPERVERSLDSRRVPMLLSVAFGAVALLLAAIGLYGVLAYQVSQRTREIGIRMTLGSDASGILCLVLKEGAALVLVGLALGLAGAVALRQAIATQLYGIGALDPGVILTVTLVLMSAALLACVAPARRAARVDPAIALTQQ
jgi:predicted permease